jgi:phosphoglycolate phosphatase-like HAD superfamily hydrolase
LSFFTNKKAIVFDFDGVLLESTGIKTWAFVELYKKYGRGVQDKVFEYQRNNGGVNRLDKFRHFHEVILNQKISDDEVNLLSNKFRELTFEKLKLTPIDLFLSEALSLFNNKDFLLYCVSASPTEELNEIMEYKKIRNFFIKIYGGPISKENNFELLSTGEGICFSDMAYIGDSKIDLVSSNNKNIDFIGYGEDIPNWGKGQYWIHNWKEVINDFIK